jgi:acyl-CoA synthetase (AMP-forming)/AMP-acid ligase II
VTTMPRAGCADVVTTAERRGELLAAGAWQAETLSDLVAVTAAERPDDLAVVDLAGARRTTWAELDSLANRVANFLVEAGIGPGDVVSVQLPNWRETVAIDLGILRAGAVVNPMLPIYRAKEITHMLGVGAVRVLFTPRTYRNFDHVEMVDSLRDAAPGLEHHIVVEDPAESADALGGLPATASDRHPEVELEAGAVSELLFTSGTEAAPKAVMHTEETTNFGARTLAASLGIGAGDVVWTPSPIGHSTGLNYGVRIALALGLPLVLQDRWSAADAVALIERFRCSYTVAATTFVSDVVEYAAENSCDVSSMRLFGSGGAPVPPEVVEAAEGLGMSVLRMYGSTEVLAATWNRPGSPRATRIATDGPALDGMEIEIRADAGEAPIGEPGEIFVRGPSTSVGFFDDPERTAGTYREGGWVASGDLGVLDAEGNLTIVGRKKEIIIRGGLNIAPREIEEAVGRHPGVAQVAVVGLPDPRLGEITCACVVLREGVVELELDDLVEFLRGLGLAAYKLPQRLELLAELPRTSTGKVQKPKIISALEPGSDGG